jgi:hypothetical protein
MHAFMPTILLGVPRFDALNPNACLSHHTDKLERPLKGIGAGKGYTIV